MTAGGFQHDVTREVFLDADPADPLDFQVNYYDYLAARLIPSTDILVAGERVYRTNVLACRGDDIDPAAPVLAIFGSDAVHGPREGGFVEQMRLAPFRVLNAGIEGLDMPQIAERFQELNAAATLAAAVVVPCLEGLAPAGHHLETYWLGLLHAFRGPDLVAFASLETADAAMGKRFNVFLRDYCSQNGFVMIERARSQGLQRWLRRGSQTNGLEATARAFEAALAEPLSRLTVTPQAVQAVGEPAGKTVLDGAADVGRNYPLW